MGCRAFVGICPDIGRREPSDAWLKRDSPEEEEMDSAWLREAWEQLTPELCGYIGLSCSFALALNFLGTFVPWK